MNFRTIATRDELQGETTCPYYLCDGSGIALMGKVDYEWERECLCKKLQNDLKKIEVVHDDEVREFYPEEN